MNRSRITMFAVAAVATIGIACGSGGTSTGSETTGGDTAADTAADTSAAAPGKAGKSPTTVAVGQPMTLTEELFGSKTVVVFTLANVKANVKSGNQFVKPAKGQYITVDVTAEVKEGKVSVHSSMFKLVGADGTVYDTTTMLDRQDLNGSDLTPGQKVAGSVVFDAAVGAEKGAKIALKSWLAEGDAGYWQLP